MKSFQRFAIVLISVCFLYQPDCDAQLKFKDGTSQETSFSGGRKPRPQSQYMKLFTGTTGVFVDTVVVPQGKELVLLQVDMDDDVVIQSQSPTAPNDIVNVVFCLSNFQSEAKFPDGLIVIDEGRRLRIQYAEADRPSNPVGVMGYYRKKIDPHPRANKRFSEAIYFPPFSNLVASSSVVVPSGKELVILRLYQLPNPIAQIGTQSASTPSDVLMTGRSSLREKQFPDGTFVIESGRKFFWDSYYDELSQEMWIGIVGYFRNK